MAVTQSIPLGMLVTLQPNVVYALPAKAATIYSDSAGIALEQSNDITFATKSTVTLVGGASKVVGAWIRSTAGPVIVRLVPD